MRKRWEKALAEAWQHPKVLGLMAKLSGQRGAISSALVKVGIFAAIAFVLIGIATNFIPTMMTGWESARTTANASEYTGYSTVVGMGPTLIVLGFVIAIAVKSFLGIKI